MIIREWRGRALVADAARYPAHFRAQVLPQLKRTKGFVWAQLGRRELGDKVEFLVLTHWASWMPSGRLRGRMWSRPCSSPERLRHSSIMISRFSTMRCSKKRRMAFVVAVPGP